MQLTVNGYKTYCYTGGKVFDATKPTAVFIHGVLHDHSVWILQTRYLANHGWNVLAVDLPGHCRSDGPPPATVEAAARFIVALLDAAGVQKAALVGHSFGSLIALDVAAQSPQRVSQLVLVGTAFPMKVSAVLLDASVNDQAKGIEMINQFSRSTLAPPPSALGPGTWVDGSSKALNHHVLASNTKANLFFTGFTACDSYADGETSMPRVECPVLFVLGRVDQMTPPATAQNLIRLARNARVVVLPVGHHEMTEAPEAMLKALTDFLQP